MTTDEMQASAVAAELRHARSAHQAARLLCDAGLYNDALNRLYYALYHTVTALLLTTGVEPRRHRALPGLLGTHFAATLSPTDLSVVARASTWRDLADYERTWEANLEVTTLAFAEIEPLIERVRDLALAFEQSPP